MRQKKHTERATNVVEAIDFVNGVNAIQGFLVGLWNRSCALADLFDQRIDFIDNFVFIVQALTQFHALLQLRIVLVVLPLPLDISRVDFGLLLMNFLREHRHSTLK